MAKLTDDQRKAIAEILTFEDETELDMLFKTAEHMPVIDVSRQERDQVRTFMKELDLMMVRLALAYHTSKEAQNVEIAEEIMLTLAGMWSDLKLIIATPTLDSVLKTDTHSNLGQVKKLLDKIKFLRPHLSHGAEEESNPRPKKPRTEATIETHNKFDVLAEPQPSTSQAHDGEDMDTNIQAAVEAPPKKERIDPIFISISGDWPAYVRHLNQNVLKTAVKAKLSGEHMKIQPKTAEDYRALTKHLVETKMAFHALMPKAERPAKVLIKGLPNFIQPEAIIADLASLGYTPMHVSALKRRGPSKDPLPLFLATLKITPGWERIYEETTILETAVVIKSFRSSGTKQCYRCQGFGHSSLNCYMPPRCMKCGQGHESRDCLKPRTEKATCANCKGSHTSNWTGCPAHPKNRKQVDDPTSYQAYLRFLKQGQKKYVDAPLPANPAWQRRNPKIYQPPSKKDEFPRLPSKTIFDSDSELSEVDVPLKPVAPRRALADDAESGNESTSTAQRRRSAEKRAAIAAAAKIKARRQREKHEEIIAENTPPSTASLSGFAEAMHVMQEFQELVDLPKFIKKLKELVEAIKGAPTEMDKAYIVMERLQGLSEAFKPSK